MTCLRNFFKQVPNEDAVIRISPDKRNIIEDNITYCTNEPDTYALEEALLIKESLKRSRVVRNSKNLTRFKV